MINRDELVWYLEDQPLSDIICTILTLGDNVLSTLYPQFTEGQCNECSCTTTEEHLDHNGNCEDCADYLDSHDSCDLCGDSFELPDLDDDNLCIDCREPKIEEEEDDD